MRKCWTTTIVHIHKEEPQQDQGTKEKWLDILLRYVGRVKADEY